MRSRLWQSVRQIWLGFLLSGISWCSLAQVPDQMAMRQWFDALNQRWLLSYEIAAYQYRHALDPPVMLQPLLAPLINYGHYVGLTPQFAQRFLQAERRVDHQLQQQWLQHWQQHGFAFDSEDFLDAPALCRKQEQLERAMLRALVLLQPALQDPYARLQFDQMMRSQVLVPNLSQAQRDQVLTVLFARAPAA